MKKINVAETTNAQLDWLVAVALGHNVKLRNWKDITDALDPVEDADIIAFHKEHNTIRVSAKQTPGSGWFTNPTYTTNWPLMGPIIDRECMEFDYDEAEQAYHAYNGIHAGKGKTHLIAAARCYVASKLGEVVEVPEELT